MAQKRIKINNTNIYQPDKDLAWAFETTYSEGSNRTQTGKGKFTPLFTVEQLTYSATDIPATEASKILKMVAKGKTFSLHYYSVYYGAWRTDDFYVGQGDITIGTLEQGNESLSQLSFKMTGINPI